MWNFAFGCFILGAASVGILHGRPEAALGILVVLLWFAGLFRPTRSVWTSYLQVGALAGSVAYAYDAFVSDLPTGVLVAAGIVAGGLAAAALVTWIGNVSDARRADASRPRARSPVPRRENVLIEVVAWIVLAGLPFGLGAWAAEADFDERDQESRAP